MGLGFKYLGQCIVYFAGSVTAFFSFLQPHIIIGQFICTHPTNSMLLLQVGVLILTYVQSKQQVLEDYDDAPPITNFRDSTTTQPKTTSVHYLNVTSSSTATPVSYQNGTTTDVISTVKLNSSSEANDHVGHDRSGPNETDDKGKDTFSFFPCLFCSGRLLGIFPL